MKKSLQDSYSGLEIAVIGMSGRFPGAKNVAEFWDNLEKGRESIVSFSHEELEQAGVSPDLLKDKNYVKAGSMLDDIEYFDASFFGYTPKEAEIMNPQTRIFYECVYEALEEAGYAAAGSIGIYAGGSINYGWEALTLVSGKNSEMGEIAATTLANKDSICTRISFKLNLKGPAISMRTACSTSLVAVHTACRSLLTRECEIALAGGVAVQNLQKRGYIYREGLIVSPDGHCRPFDGVSQGTVFGDGAGVVVLKKLKDALQDGDYIYAVIKGSALNNDGLRKVGYTAPSVEGQADVIRSALKIAGLNPESIGYIETHGTGTHIGDTIEMEALKLVFAGTKKRNFCGIGSVKSNVGHLDSAAGIAGFIKTVLSLKHRLIPPSVNFEIPNPEIDFIDSPFYVNARLTPWEDNTYPLRAGVSSFGLGGTNAHVVLEEAPADYDGEAPGSAAVRGHHLLVLSAKTGSALEKTTGNLLDYLKANLANPVNGEFSNPGNSVNHNPNLADVAFTLQVGRRDFKHRRMLLCTTREEAVDILSSPGSAEIRTAAVTAEDRPVIFVFPGEEEGSRFVDMGLELYKTEPLFREELDRCLKILSPGSPSPDRMPVEKENMPLLVFACEYALGSLFKKAGIEPAAAVGRGVGRCAAACVSGELSLQEALKQAAGKGEAGQEESLAELLQVVNALFLHFGLSRVSGTVFNRRLDKKKGQVSLSLAGSAEEGIPAPRRLLHTIGCLWLHGVEIDWAGFYSKEKRHRIPLPTYPFERERYWIEGNLSGMQPGMPAVNVLPGETALSPGMAAWFYVPSWKCSVLQPGRGVLESSLCWLVFANELNLTALLVKKLREDGQNVVVVKKGDAFKQVGIAADCPTYTLNPAQSHCYDDLFAGLRSAGLLPGKIIHLWNVTGGNGSAASREAFAAALDPGFYSLWYMAKAIGKQGFSHDIHITLLADNLQEVTGEEILCPGKAAVLGLLKVIPQEFPGIVCSSIDIPVPEPGSIPEQELIDDLLAEFTTAAFEPVIAYRNGKRWLRIYEPFVLPEPPQEQTGLRKKGVYLLTDGLQETGLIFAELLAKTAAARLVLTGSSPFPAKDEWPRWLESHDEADPIALKIKKLQHCEEIGGEILCLQADITDLEQVRAAVSRAEEIFGKINGVIHLSGIMAGRSIRPIRELSDRDCREYFPAPVYGIMVLEEVLKDKEFDFCWILSSLSCVLGGLGFAVYAAANMFMETFIKQHNRFKPSSNRWSCLNWENMDADTSAAAFARIFSLKKIDQLVFSKGGNLPARIDRWIKLETGRNFDNERDFRARPDISTAYEAPRNQGEQAMVNIWQGILGYDEIGIRDDFLELGGDSLKAITIISRVYHELNVNVPVTEFFSRPTIAELAEYILENRGENTLAAVRLAEEKEYYPLTPAQKRLFIIRQMSENNTGYNISTIVELEGEVDRGKIAGTFKKLIHRHESFRTDFAVIAAEPVQKIHRPAAIDFAMEYCEKGTIKGFIRPFDLSRAPLFRAGLIKIAEDDHILMVDMHHIITDGFSMEILVKEFIALYAEEELPLLSFQYKDYADWRNSAPVQAVIKEQENYWLQEFAADVPATDIPLDYDRPRFQDFSGDAVEFEIDKEETKGLNDLAAAADATLFMVLLAVYNVLLAKLSGQEDIVVGIGVAGRRHEEVQHIIGMFVNTLAVRNFPRRESTFKEFLAEVRQRTLLTFENQDYQFEDLVEKVVKEKNWSRNPLFDTALVLQNLEVASRDYTLMELPGLTVKPYVKKQRVSRFEMTWFCVESAGRLLVRVEYCTKLFKRETIESFIAYFKEILSRVIKNGDVKLKDITVSHDLLSAESVSPEMELAI